jgi:SAM-dependent methyltransferase
MIPSNSTEFWHTRFIQQAAWTEAIRHKLLNSLEVGHADTILEVGSGTGVILNEISNRWSARVIGLDLDRKRLRFSQQYAPRSFAVHGDGMHLPYKPACIDLCLCHFLLLWVADPFAVLQEMVRVTRPQGWVMALAEPDYDGRIDYPPALVELGQLQAESLEDQGADLKLGRRLMSLFLKAGLSEVAVGVLGGEWRADGARRTAREEEWAVMLSDLGENADPAQLSAIKQDWLDDGHILFVPTFYAMGKVPT